MSYHLIKNILWNCTHKHNFEPGTGVYRIIRKVLEDFWSDKIAIVWCADDIIHHGKELGYDNKEKSEITKTQAVDILGILEQKHDCSYGISWSTVEFAIDYYFNKDKLT